MNLYENKHVVIVGVNENELAKKVISKFEENGFKNVTLISAPKSYPGFYQLAEMAGDYTMILEQDEECRVRSCVVEGFKGDRLGNYVERDRKESDEAKNIFEHYFRMLELKPNLLGGYKIPFDEVKDIEWFYESKTPFINVTAPDVNSCDEAIVNSVIDYFKKKFSE